MVGLAKSKYGHHLVRKLINVAKKEDVPGLLKLFKGHMVELLRHPHGADVMTDLFDVASSGQRNAMCAEFYGKEYALFDGVARTGGDVSNLRALMEAEGGAKRVAILQRLTKGLLPIVEKALLHPPMVHRLLREFLSAAPGLSIEDFVDSLSQTGAAVLKMVHTHDGAAAVCMMLAYGGAKERKRLVKAMKGFVKEMATNEWAHAVVCTTLSVVDDTALTAKVIVAELKACLPELVESQHGRRVLLQLLSPGNRRYLTASVLEMMAPPQRTVKGAAKKADAGGESDEEEAGGAGGGGEEGGDAAAAGSSGGKRRKDKGDAGKASKKAKVDASGAGAGDDEAEAGPSSASGGEGGAAAAAGGEVVERVLGVSKKDPALRVRELLSAGGAKGSLATALTALCAERAGPLLRHRYGNDVIAEVSRGGDGGVLTQICPDGVAAVHEAILAEAERSKDDVSTAGAAMGEDGAAGPAGPPMEHVLVDYFSSRALRRLVLASDEDGEGSAAASFSAAFWLRVLDGRCKSWVGSHADKVLAAFLHCGAPAARAAAAKQLQPLVKESLVEWSQRFVGPANGHHGLHPRPEPGAGSGAVAPSTAAGAKRGRAAGATGSKGGKAAAAAEAEHFEFEDTAAGAGEAIAKGPAASGKQAGGKAGNPPPAVVAKKAKPELPPAAAAASAERQADGAAAASGGRRPSGRAAAAGVKTIQEAAVAAPVAAAAAAAAADSLPRSPIKTRSSRQGATAKK